MMLLQKYSDGLYEAGCDEAGRGCLAGPVFAAAVILPPDFWYESLDDSKKLTEKKRNYFRQIIETEAVAWSVSMLDNRMIDQVNILNASIAAMHMAIKTLKVTPEFLLVDGNRFKTYPGIPHNCVVRGDSKFMNIAAASILAKTHRDEYMEKLHELFPDYGWKQNKGYPTRGHRQALAKFGITVYHRKTFHLL